MNETEKKLSSENFQSISQLCNLLNNSPIYYEPKELSRKLSQVRTVLLELLPRLTSL